MPEPLTIIALNLAMESAIEDAFYYLFLAWIIYFVVFDDDDDEDRSSASAKLNLLKRL